MSLASMSSPVGALLCAAGLSRIAKSFIQLTVDEFLGLSMRVSCAAATGRAAVRLLGLSSKLALDRAIEQLLEDAYNALIPTHAEPGRIPHGSSGQERRLCFAAQAAGRAQCGRGLCCWAIGTGIRRQRSRASKSRRSARPGRARRRPARRACLKSLRWAVVVYCTAALVF